MINTIPFEEHVFGTAKADPLGAEGDGVADLIGLIGIGADFEFPTLVGPLHKLSKDSVNWAFGRGHIFIDEHPNNIGRGGFNFAWEDFSSGAVDGKEVAFVESLSADGEGGLGVVDMQVGCSTDTDFAHLAGNEGGMRGNSPTGGENAFGSQHPANVLGASFNADEENF